MSEYYKNSLVIDFTVVPIRPKLERVRDFIFNQMGIDISVIKNLQTRIIKAHVVMEVETAELAEKLVNEHNMKHTIENEGELYRIPVYTAENIKEVRVFDLPCQMPNSIIIKSLSTFGEVISIRNDVWKNIFTGLGNGTRFVRMKIQKPIPSYVMMGGVMSYITYNGQTRTCKHCAFPLHIGKSCSQNRKDIVEKGNSVAEIIQLPNLENEGQSSSAGNSVERPLPQIPCNENISDVTTEVNSEVQNNESEESDFSISDDDNDHDMESYPSDAPQGEPSCGSTSQPIGIPTERLTSKEREKSNSQPELQRSSSTSRKARSRTKANTTVNVKRLGSPKEKEPKRVLRPQK